MNVTLWAIWCHLFNLKDVKNTHGGVSTRSDTGGWVVFMFGNYTNGTKSRKASQI